MIHQNFIREWERNYHWKEIAQVEQDLVIARAIVEIFSDDFLRKSLAFREGTALIKSDIEYDSVTAWESVKKELSVMNTE